MIELTLASSQCFHKY
ncbi:rCG23694, partial [Rattus norvegicus]